MNRLEKVLYTASPYHGRARRRVAAALDGRLNLAVAEPGTSDTGTNPEQLFAAGWSACFESAMEFAARNLKIALPADHAVDAEIDLGPEGVASAARGAPLCKPAGDGARDRQRLIEATHLVCPYSRATHGNIAVETTLV